MAAASGAGLRSPRGAWFRLLGLVGTGRFEMAISATLIREYEDILKRQAADLGQDVADVSDAIDHRYAVGHRERIVS